MRVGEGCEANKPPSGKLILSCGKPKSKLGKSISGKTFLTAVSKAENASPIGCVILSSITLPAFLIGCIIASSATLPVARTTSSVVLPTALIASSILSTSSGIAFQQA